MPAPSAAGSAFPKMPTGVHRLMLIQYVDKGMRPSTYAGKTRMIHSITLVHESTRLVQDGEFEGQPFLLFSGFNYWYGKEGSTGRVPYVVPFIEAHLGREMTSDERFVEGKMFAIEDILGKTVKADIAINDRGYAYAKSWFPDVDDDGNMNKPWEMKAVHYQFSKEHVERYCLQPDKTVVCFQYQPEGADGETNGEADVAVDVDEFD